MPLRHFRVSERAILEGSPCFAYTCAVHYPASHGIAGPYENALERDTHSNSPQVQERPKMVKRVILPSDALDDFRTLIRLSSDQLKALDELFASGESVSALRTTFVNQVAEDLQLNLDEARSVTVVCSFLLSLSDKEDEGSAGEILDDVREFLENSLPDEDKDSVLGQFDQNCELISSLATPKPARKRAQKIRGLLAGPEPHVHSFRTICQLRPLFEGQDNDETIVGLVPMILLEIESADADGDANTLSFSMDAEDLAESQKVVERTRMKLEAIQKKYKTEILTTE